MAQDSQPRWICPVCRYEARSAEPGLRCPDHPDWVLVHPPNWERFPDDHVLGRVIADKYAVYGVLGMGGFGAVYRAIQEPVGRPVALKVVHARNAHDPELRARFFREARIVARLRDPVVVTLHDYGEVPTIGLYMVFELVDGRTFNRLLAEGPQPAERVAHLALQLLRALGEAHALGMVHRDLKPANVMVVEGPSGEEQVRLLDFGIAKVVTQEDQERSLQTQQGLVMGTPRYLSPEQARATGDIDLRSDLYSLGVIMYSLLAGANPFERPSVIETIMAHCNTPPPPLDPSLGVPPAFEAVIRKALEKEPHDRYDSARDMAIAIREALPGASFPSARWRDVPSVAGEVEPGFATPSGFRATPSGAASMAPVSGGHATGGPGSESVLGATPSRGTPSRGTRSRPLDEPLGTTPTGGSWSGLLEEDEPPPRSGSRRVGLVLALVLLFVVGTLGGLWWTGALTGAPTAAPLRTERPPPLAPGGSDPAPGSSDPAEGAVGPRPSGSGADPSAVVAGGTVDEAFEGEPSGGGSPDREASAGSETRVAATDETDAIEPSPASARSTPGRASSDRRDEERSPRSPSRRRSEPEPARERASRPAARPRPERRVQDEARAPSTPPEPKQEQPPEQPERLRVPEF